MSSLPPRVVVVTRRSEYDELLARHSTRAAAAYFLGQRGRDVADVQARHEALRAALAAVGTGVPADWRQGHVDREDLPRFLFGPEDVVVAVGQDGLVANVAKYLDGQPVVGVDPEPGRNAGVLVRHAPGRVGRILPAVVAGDTPVEDRTMVEATLDDGQTLVGLNEVYVGHAGHQSSRYVLYAPAASPARGGSGAPRHGGSGAAGHGGSGAAGHGGSGAAARERQSSSGLVVGTGTGATGWCASIAHDRAAPPDPPRADEPALCWYVREAWPSPATGATLTAGTLAGTDTLELTSESERLVAFADGLEPDHLTLAWGQRITVGVAAKRLRLVVPAG